MTPTPTDNHPGAVTVTNNIGKFPITSNTTITWTYTDAAGNTATQTQEVMINPLSVVDDLAEIMIFPNPSGHYLEVRSPRDSPINILGLGGELLLKSTTNTRIDAASLQSGLYLVQLPDGRLLKFIKK